MARILQCFPQPYAFILSRALMISALCTYSILYAYCIQEYIILYSRISTWLSIPTLYSMSYQKRIIDLESQVKSTQYKKLCGSYIKIWNLPNYMKKQNKEHQNARFINEKLKTKSLMFFVSFFSCDLQDFQILIREPQSVGRKLLVLSWLYTIYHLFRIQQSIFVLIFQWQTKVNLQLYWEDRYFHYLLC